MRHRGHGKLQTAIAALAASGLLIAGACGPPQIVITITGRPTASSAVCGDKNYTVQTIITNQSNRDVILSITAPTQDKLTAGASTGVGRIPANGVTTVKTPVELDS